MSRTTAALLVSVALLYTLHGLIPGRLLVPADLPRDLLAWKGRADVRVRVSNSLLSDVAVQFIPWDVEARRQLIAGHWPWRNRFAAEGAPLFANPQAALLSFFTWPRLLFGLRGWAWAVLLKLLVAGFGMYWLGRVVGLSDRASCISAIVFTLAGFTTTLSLHPHTNVFVILPALCAACVARRPFAIAVLAALATAGGHPETLFLGAIAIALFVRPVKWTIAAAFAGFLIVAVQVVPFAILLWNSHARVARAAELPAHFRALSIVSLIAPGILGSPLRGELDLTGTIPNAENFVTRTGGYVGALVLIAILLSWRTLPPLLRRGMWIGIVGLLLSWWIPGVRDLLGVIPVVRWIAFDYFVIPFVLFASLAAGPAILNLGRNRVGVVLMAIGVVLIGFGALPILAPDLLLSTARRGIAYLQQRGHLHQAADVYVARLSSYIVAAKWTAIRRALLPGLCWTAFGWGLMSSRTRVVVAAAILELIFFGYGFAPSIRVAEVAPMPAAIAQIGGTPFFIAASGDAFPANLGTLYGVRQVDSYDVLTSEERTQQLVRAGYDPFLHIFSRPTPALADLGVRFWIGENGVTEFPNARLPAPAEQGPPKGFVVGVIGSAIGFLMLVGLLRYSHSIVDGGLDEMS